MFCEVLEHLQNPEKVLAEIYRILRTDGILILSSPFLFPVHADPYDFQRWTDTKIEAVLQSIGYSDIKIGPMGGVGTVIHDILVISLKKMQSRYLRKLCLLVVVLAKPVFGFLEKKLKPSEKMFTSGYFVTAKK